MKPILMAMAPLLAASLPSVAEMKWQRRILLVTASSADDAGLREQRRIVARWKAEGEARDLSVVELAGNAVAGARDDAATLRKRYGLPATGFMVVLIGKDGGDKLRSERPIAADVLEATIDAMPMRRGGDR